MDFQLIEQLSQVEQKSILARAVKLQEEVGELAQEILISQNVSGTQHKTQGPDGILGESIDVMLVALSIYFAAGGTVSDLDQKVADKCLKWKKYQLPQAS